MKVLYIIQTHVLFQPTTVRAQVLLIHLNCFGKIPKFEESGQLDLNLDEGVPDLAQ